MPGQQRRGAGRQPALPLRMAGTDGPARILRMPEARGGKAEPRARDAVRQSCGHALKARSAQPQFQLAAEIDNEDVSKYEPLPVPYMW